MISVFGSQLSTGAYRYSGCLLMQHARYVQWIMSLLDTGIWIGDVINVPAALQQCYRGKARVAPSDLLK